MENCQRRSSTALDSVENLQCRSSTALALVENSDSSDTAPLNLGLLESTYTSTTMNSVEKSYSTCKNMTCPKYFLSGSIKFTDIT